LAVLPGGRCRFGGGHSFYQAVLQTGRWWSFFPGGGGLGNRPDWSPLRRDLILVIAYLPHISHLGIVRLAEQSSEACCIQQRVFPAVHGDHPEAKRFMAYRCSEF
jgi:hypothetical protein